MNNRPPPTSGKKNSGPGDDAPLTAFNQTAAKSKFVATPAASPPWFDAMIVPQNDTARQNISKSNQTKKNRIDSGLNRLIDQAAHLATVTGDRRHAAIQTNSPADKRPGYGENRSLTTDYERYFTRF